MKLETKIKVKEFLDPIMEESVEIGIVMAGAGAAHKGIMLSWDMMEILGVSKAVRYAIICPLAFVSGMGISTIAKHAKNTTHLCNNADRRAMNDWLQRDKDFEKWENNC